VPSWVVSFRRMSVSCGHAKQVLFDGCSVRCTQFHSIIVILRPVSFHYLRNDCTISVRVVEQNLSHKRKFAMLYCSIVEHLLRTEAAHKIKHKGLCNTVNILKLSPAVTAFDSNTKTFICRSAKRLLHARRSTFPEAGGNDKSSGKPRGTDCHPPSAQNVQLMARCPAR